ncbi:Crp/Fnr family transcriptional regulator [Danxiaibacter flavus]|uniref:Crp/Fnr family transcriptional regulator n=1 Tax=Danxiaibacter flavus TaxID=3049108 RepID=A0ABV3ZJB5_9BACT|nr:Crp/Fnr family transcriptional regulator [Chitinophagaceae bacterium DXS]
MSFQTYLRTNTSLADEDIDLICSVAMSRSLHRNELLLQQGQICRHKIFVVDGLLRNYGIAEDGSEHILQFSPQHTWTLDVESYDRQTPSQYNIAAVERSEVLLWTKADFDVLLSDIPAFKMLSQQLISHNIYNSRQRLLTALSATPEEKYEDFVRNFPDLLSRLPLHMIASYLGISLKTLTRIRHAQIHR